MPNVWQHDIFLPERKDGTGEWNSATSSHKPKWFPHLHEANEDMNFECRETIPEIRKAFASGLQFTNSFLCLEICAKYFWLCLN